MGCNSQASSTPFSDSLPKRAGILWRRPSLLSLPGFPQGCRTPCSWPWKWCCCHLKCHRDHPCPSVYTAAEVEVLSGEKGWELLQEATPSLPQNCSQERVASETISKTLIIHQPQRGKERIYRGKQRSNGPQTHMHTHAHTAGKGCFSIQMLESVGR